MANPQLKNFRTHEQYINLGQKIARLALDFYISSQSQEAYLLKNIIEIRLAQDIEGWIIGIVRQEKSEFFIDSIKVILADNDELKSIFICEYHWT